MRLATQCLIKAFESRAMALPWSRGQHVMDWPEDLHLHGKLHLSLWHRIYWTCPNQWDWVCLLDLKQWKYCWYTMQHTSGHAYQGKLWLVFTATSRIIDLSHSLLLSFTIALHCHFPIFLWLPHAGLLEKKTGHRTFQVAVSSLLTCASGIVREESSQTQSVVLTSHIWPMFLDGSSHFTGMFSTQQQSC